MKRHRSDVETAIARDFELEPPIPPSPVTVTRVGPAFTFLVLLYSSLRYLTASSVYTKTSQSGTFLSPVSKTRCGNLGS